MTKILKVGRYDFANVGDSEARFGTDYLRTRQKETGVPYISANLVQSGKMKPVLSPYVIKKVGGLEIGFLGILDFISPMPTEIAAHGLDITDPLECAAQ